MTDLQPVCDDLGAFIISGRVRGVLEEMPQHESDVRTPAMGVDDAAEAERLGFRRVWIAERFDLKESAVVLSAAGARTSRLGLSTGIVAIGARHPMHLAAYGATMHAVHGPRFALGLGRGAAAYSHGKTMSLAGYSDYCSILKRLWAGEHFEYSGPAGDFGRLGLADTYPGTQPEIWAGVFGLPKGAEMVARTPAIDGVLIPIMLIPEAVHEVVTNLREACERFDRDPATLRLALEVVTCPDMEEEEMRNLAHARAVTYLQPEGWSTCFEQLNHWDVPTLEKLRAHPKFTAVGGGKELADLKFHRIELKDVARLIPDKWMEDSCAIGTVDECVKKLQVYKDAGVDEIATYASTPGQNAKLIAAWRQHTSNRRRSSGVGEPATV